MNRTLKSLLLTLFLTTIVTNIWAQDIASYDSLEPQKIQIRDYENGFLFNVFNIENVEERVQLASALATSEIWLCNPADNPGELFIRPNSDNADIPIYAEFDYLRMTLREEYEEALLLPKEEFAEVFNTWAQNISIDFYNFLISDRLDRANHCMDAEPFCTSDVYNFPALNSGVSWSGPNYGCLGSSPTSKQSFWYYMRIGVAGNITIKIQASFDVDFALWGPFSNETDPCPTAAGQTGLLTATCTNCPNNTSSDANYPYGNLHDCSFSAQSYEYAHVVNGQVGQYYILLITNYSGSSGNITFQKYAGNGETDCGIMPPLVDNDGPYCVGETIHLTANGQSGATYSWTGPGGFTSNQQNPTRPNCTMAMAGQYTCTIALGGQTNSATTNVVVYPKPTANFTATTVCKGNPTQFTSTSTTNPSGQQMTYQWNFGDGQTSTQQNPSHTYSQAGSFPVTLTVSCGNGHCTSSKTQNVTVYAAPIANAGPDQTIGYGGTAQLSGNGGAGQFTYQWSPANMVTNPNAQNTQTVALTSDQTYTLTVSSPQGGCTSTDQVTIHISGSAMTVNAGPNISICQGGSGQIYVSAGGGTGNITYSWTPTSGLSNPNIANPIASPTQTTTYTCHVSDGQTSQNASVTVTVNDVIEEHEFMTICPGEYYQWHGTPYDSEGTYQFDTLTDQGCDKTVYLHLDQYPSYDETTITETRCFGESYEFYGTTYTSSISTSYTDHTIHGCDSIVRLELTVWPENQIEEIPVSLCPEQLPYYYEEDPNQIPLYEGLHIFHPEDEHGCERTVWVDINVSDYYQPPLERKYVCELPYIWEIRDVDNSLITTRTINTADFYTDTIQTAGCQGIFRLDLHFQQIPEVEHTYVTVCDSYHWPINGENYSQSGNYQYSIPLYDDPTDPSTLYPCSQDYMLHLTVNKSDLTAHQEYYNECDSIRFEWFGRTLYFKENGTYVFPNEEYPDGQTTHSCDTTMTVTITNMKFTPKPVIECSDQNIENPHWPITATEFNVNRYTYYASDPKSDASWYENQCEWSISKPSWRIVPSDDNRSCTVYAMDWVEDTIWLSFKAVNPCSGEGITTSYWLKPSFYGIEEQEAYPAVVDIIPNPNNGQMQLRFENMEGKLNIKVYTMSGALVDSFELKTIGVGETYDYSMKRLVNGVYFFTITDGKRSVTKKVVIIH